MNKELVKKIIILSVIIIILILVSIIILVVNRYRPNVNIVKESNAEKTIEQKEIEEVIRDKEFYKVSNLVNIYLDTLNKNKYKSRDGESFADSDQTKESIYSLLSEEYIDKNNITLNNLYKNVYDINDKINFVPIEMRVIEKFGINKYLVYGEAVNINNANIENKQIYIIVNIDEINETYSIEQINEDIYDIDDYNFTNEIKSIEENKYNKFDKTTVNDEFIALQKFNNFKFLTLTDSQLVYDRYLDQEYKEKRFPTYEDYKKYLEVSYDRFYKMELYQYASKQNDDFLQNVYTDKNGCYYVFNQTKSSDYTVLLDSYTVLSDEFKKTYTNANNKNKVQMNINKWVEMLNNKDYLAAYNVLDETFRTTKFTDFNNFAEIMSEIFLDQYTAEATGEYNSFSEEENNTFIQKISLKNKNYDIEGRITGNIIMQLGEEYNYVMSFRLETTNFE